MRSTAGSIGDWLTDPAPVLPGMIEVSLDSGGRLRSFSAVPPERSNSKATAAQPDWRPLLEAAGFDPGTLEPMQPTWSPPVFADSVVAYAAVYPDAPDVNVQIHAASLRGRPVWFRIIEPWARERAPGANAAGFWARAGEAVNTVWFVFVLVGASWVAIRNVRLLGPNL